MNYKCTDCGHIFEDCEASSSYEYVAEAWGRRIYEQKSYCPHCGSDAFEEAVKCQKCNAVFLNDELSDGLCGECVKEVVKNYKYDIAGCYKMSQKDGNKQEVEIDLFLSCMFTESQINDILFKELASISAIRPVDCTPFIEYDPYWFEQNAIEEVKKNDNR